MKLTLNGKDYQLTEGATAFDLLSQLSIGKQRIALEVNEQIVPKSEHEQWVLKTGDKVEVIMAVGGG